MEQYREMLDTILAPTAPPDDLLKCCQLVLEFADDFLASDPENAAALYSRFFSQQTRRRAQQQRREIKILIRSRIKEVLRGRLFRLFGVGNSTVGFGKTITNAAFLTRNNDDPLHFEIEVDDSSDNLLLVTTEAFGRPQYVYGYENRFYLSQTKQPRAYLRYSTLKKKQRQSTQTSGGRRLFRPSGNTEGFLIVFEKDGKRYHMDDSSLSNDLTARPLTSVENPPERSLWKVWEGDAFPPQRVQQAKRQQAQPEEDHQRTYQQLLRIPRRRSS
ncbi:hypothetical protein EBZ80_02025 [bacterium]|nr:hypothetical protein [bacterium]